MTTSDVSSRPRVLWDMNGYQWVVLFAAWLGWGLDVFDGVLFNFVAPNCVPTLLGIPLGTPEAKSASLTWIGILTSLLLVGWGVGGIVFGRLCDQIGRAKTLLITMTLYAGGTALCAIAPNIWVLILCRAVASLGIGGEWAAGAAMVAEVVPEKRRIEAGTILAAASPAGLFFATFVTYQIQGVFLKDQPSVAWRYVFLAGLIPVVAAIVLRRYLKEPETWRALGGQVRPKLTELFGPKYRAVTLGGFGLSLVAVLTWWCVNAFIPTVAAGLATKWGTANHLTPTALRYLGEQWKSVASTRFNIGGLIGILLAIPMAKWFARRVLFLLYFAVAGISILATFGLALTPPERLWGYFFIGLSVQGVFACFTFFLPELFPARLRGTGSGFCYNAGRFVAAIGPFVVGSIAAMGANAEDAAVRVLCWVGIVPLAGLLILPFVAETRNRQLADI